MADSHSSRDDLATLFVSVTGDETVTERQHGDATDRELREAAAIEDAVADGLDEAIAGAEPDTGDPGELAEES